MFSNRLFKSADLTANASLPQERNDLAPRLILTIKGDVFYANDGFADLCGLQTPKGRNFLELAQFCDPDEAFRQSSFLYGEQDSIFIGLRGGCHDVLFHARPHDRITLQFDLTKSIGGTSYIIVSALAEDTDFVQSAVALINKSDSIQNPNARHFFNLSNDALCSSDNNGIIESINETFTNLLGYAFEELEGRSFIDFVHPDDKAAVWSDWQKLMWDGAAETQTIDMECRLISKEAQTFWMLWKHKKIEGVLYSAGNDITAIKRHEIALERRERQLIDAESIGKMGHWHWRLGSQDIRFSEELYRLFGVDQARFRPTLESVNERLHRRDAGRMEQAFQRAVIEQSDHEIDFRLITPAGETRYIRCLGRCEFDDLGDVIGLYGVMQDVSENMIQQNALREAKDAAERAYAAKSQFLANMSHELRTPLNAIIGFSEMIQQQLLGPIGNDRYLDYIKGINESGQHLLDLITDILDMSKIEAGKYELYIEEINIAKVVRLAVHMVESRANENAIKIAVNIPDENQKIHADRRAVMQMTLNLLSNAIKFSQHNGKVDVDCVSKDGFISLRVRDNGIGIPAHKLPTIMNPFEQAENQYTRSHEGTGLGLSITKELAELHGGSVHIDSKVNVGTSVLIRLPIDARQTRRDFAKDV